MKTVSVAGLTPAKAVKLIVSSVAVEDFGPVAVVFGDATYNKVATIQKRLAAADVSLDCETTGWVARKLMTRKPDAYLPGAGIAFKGVF